MVPEGWQETSAWDLCIPGVKKYLFIIFALSYLFFFFCPYPCFLSLFIISCIADEPRNEPDSHSARTGSSQWEVWSLPSSVRLPDFGVSRSFWNVSTLISDFIAPSSPTFFSLFPQYLQGNLHFVTNTQKFAVLISQTAHSIITKSVYIYIKICHFKPLNLHLYTPDTLSLIRRKDNGWIADY